MNLSATTFSSSQYARSLSFFSFCKLDRNVAPNILMPMKKKKRNSVAGNHFNTIYNPD